MFKFLKKIVGDSNDREVKQITPIADEIEALEGEFKALGDEQLAAKTAEFKDRLAKGEDLDDILPEAFATVREAARREIGQFHYRVQLIGGIVLHQGKIAEMKTGEGKTLVATLPLYLNALEGKGCHLVTVNDYLAKVGAGWMGPIYHRLGLSVGFIAHDYSALFDPDFVDPDANPEDQRLVHWRPCARREAYAADITYGTNNEFGFDYLRDNMVVELNQLAQRPLNYAIVDEVDNILIDEARTPLIISGPSQESSAEYKNFARLVPMLKPSSITPDQAKKEGLEPDGDFMIDLRSKGLQLTDSGIAKMEHALGIPEDESLYDPKYYQLTHFLDNAMKAQFVYHRDHDYVVENGEVVIVDEFTGRKMPGRRWSDGLHQAVEAKENVAVKQENVTLATITFQNYFRMYKKLGGMTGTAYTEREELGKIYNIDVVVIPTNRGMVRQDLDDQIYRTEPAKFDAVLREIKEMQEIGRPVLVGTTSVETSERLSNLLQRNGVKHAVLNAKQHEREAHIVAQAGRLGAVTIATNMAGRGTDILLGGNPDGLIEEILERQKIKIEEATPEQIKEALTEAKKLTEAERQKVLDLGGLHIVGTERHEARRIDNQLRGRAGRQGDPGSSRFYLSLEDELMRRFGPMERVKGIMERLGVEDDVPIEARLINRSIEGAQTRVEGQNFDYRKHTVEFDDVMNKQRTIIYADRRAILEGQDMRERILQMIGEEVGSLIDQHLPEAEGEEWDAEALLRAVRTIDPMLPAEITPESLLETPREEIEALLLEQIEDDYIAREEAITPENMRYAERRMMLGAIDRQWIDYLTGMEDLRQEIGMQAIAQRDPLLEYQRNAFSMFDELKHNIQRDIVYQIIQVSFQYEAYMRQVLAEQQQRLAQAQHAGETEEQAKAAKTVRKPTAAKIGRNDPCPCGSGKKFKQCHEGREGELFALLQGRANAAPASAPVAQPAQPAAPAAPASVSAQLATGGSGLNRPAAPTSAAPRGRAAPPANTPPSAPSSKPGNGKGGKTAPQAQRGKAKK
ncbi:preprotein translocase subunit SecA [Kouleothrix aurantiaca]|uniref:Protein translocase subunit SecA n=1 Tax=Kouleothrix aurantiaca TaxID=186479 RepID=A0A0P9FL43_9CHLR|nr:preprotein translocase subunit SecA [Kouleothrix aurantiaca]